MGALRALVVEDDAKVAELVRCVLAEAGVEVSVAATVAEAESLMAEAMPDVLFTDLSLPDGRGEDMLRLMEIRGDRVPTVVVSGDLPGAGNLPRWAVAVAKPLEIARLPGILRDAVRGLGPACSGRGGISGLCDRVEAMTRAVEETRREIRHAGWAR